MPAATNPQPLTVHYSPWKVGAMASLIACLSAWWAWRGIDALVHAAPRTFHHWLTPTLAVVLTLAILAGIASLFHGRTDVVVIDAAGLTVPDLYEDRIPWPAIGGITIVRGRGVVLEVKDGASYGRKMTRNVRASGGPASPDLACIRSGLLDQNATAILASLKAHQDARSARPGRR